MISASAASLELAYSPEVSSEHPFGGGQEAARDNRGFEPQLTYSAHLLLHPGLDRAVRAFLLQEQAAVRAGLPRWQAETGFKEEG